MPIKVAAWNTEARLSSRTTKRRGTPQHILEEICRLDADVVVLPEAYYKNPAPGVDDRLRRHGYKWHDAAYNDIDYTSSEVDGDRRNVHVRVLSRLPIENVRTPRFGDVRTLICVTVREPDSGRQVLVIATHLDDRSEVLRLRQVEAVAQLIRHERLPVVMLGDFNAVWDSTGARIMRSRAVRLLANHAPGKWLRGVATRFADMASGTALKYLADQAGLRDADTKRRATATPKLHGVEWLPSIRIAQLDHILISDDLTSDNVTVMPDGGSDHRAIVTTIRFKD